MNPELRAKLDRLKAQGDARRAAASQPPVIEDAPPTVEFDNDLIPDPGGGGRPEDADLDRVVRGIDILEAYRRWCGKMEPKVGNRREGIKVSCPIPGHLDRDPSAWINLDEDVWFCAGCEEGGDKFDIAAWHFGHAVPGYKTDGTFPELRRQMAQDFGYTVVRSGGTEWVEKTAPVLCPVPGESPEKILPDNQPRCDVSIQGESAPGDSGAQVIQFPTFDDEPIDLPTIDWQAVVKPDTFLWDWMQATEPYDLPTEYFFWLGCQAVAAACGDDVVLEEYPPIEPNLFVCLTGPTGIGKSRASTALLDQLRDSLPYDFTDPNTKGTLVAKQPASGEALLKVFSRVEKDTDGTVIGYKQVRAIVRYDELAALVGRATRMGNTLKPQIISLYDGDAQGDSAMTRADTEVENPFCQMISTTQPGKIRDLLTQGDADSGFINRWIFAMGPAKKLQSYGRKPFDASVCSWALKKVHANAAHGRRYVLEGAALEEWTTFFERELLPLKANPDTNPVYVRADLTLFKLMVIFAANDLAHAVTVDHVRAAIALWPYLRKTYEIVAGALSIDLTEECCEVILSVLPELRAKLGKDPSLRDIWDRKLKGRKRYSRDLVTKAIQILVRMTQIDELLPPKTDGRGTVRYRLAKETGGGFRAT